MTNGCVFCEIASGRVGAPRLRLLEADGPAGQIVSFEPLSPVVAGHTLVVGERHTVDFTEDAEVTAAVMFAAVSAGRQAWPCNLITSAGGYATQTVFHLHVHIVPRGADDGLKLPWSDQHG